MSVNTSYLKKLLQETSWKLDDSTLCEAYGPAVIHDSLCLNALITYASHCSNDLTWEEAAANIPRREKLGLAAGDIATAMANHKSKRRKTNATNHNTFAQLEKDTDTAATAASSPESTIFVQHKDDALDKNNEASRQQTPVDLSTDDESDVTTDHSPSPDDVLTFRGRDWVSTRAVSTVLRHLFVRRDVSNEIVVHENATDKITIPRALIVRLQRLPGEPIYIPILHLKHWFSVKVSLIDRQIAVMNSKWALGNMPLKCATTLGKTIASRLAYASKPVFEVLKEAVPQQNEETECAIHTLVNMLRATCTADQTLTTTPITCAIWRLIFRNICGDPVDLKKHVMGVLNVNSAVDKHNVALIGLAAKDLVRERDKVLVDVRTVSSTSKEMSQVLALVNAISDHLRSSLITLSENIEMSKEFQRLLTCMHDAHKGLSKLRTSSDTTRYGVPHFASLQDLNAIAHVEKDLRRLKHELIGDVAESDRLKKSSELLRETQASLDQIASNLKAHERSLSLRSTEVTKALQERKAKLRLNSDSAKTQKRKLDEEAAAAEEAAQRAAKKKKEVEERMREIEQSVDQYDKELTELDGLVESEDGSFIIDGD